MDDMITEIAERILSHTKGFGRWDTKQGYKVPDNAIHGLCIGDVVYAYSEDAQQIEEYVVRFVMRGVAYIVDGIGHFGPMCYEVTEDKFSRSIADAVNAAREQIQEDLRYAQQSAATIAKLEALLNP